MCERAEKYEKCKGEQRFKFRHRRMVEYMYAEDMCVLFNRKINWMRRVLSFEVAIACAESTTRGPQPAFVLDFVWEIV